MATEVIMPKVDMVMDTGTFVEWLKKEGDHVEKGEPLFIVLTDKANIEVEAPAGGTLAGLRAQPNDVIPVTEVIAYILEPGEALPSAAGAPAQSAPPAPVPADAPRTVPAASHPSPVTADVQLSEAEAGDGKARATPAARRLAAELGVDLALVSGHGARGRIHTADVQAFAEHQSLRAAEQPLRAAEQPLRAAEQPLVTVARPAAAPALRPAQWSPAHPQVPLGEGKVAALQIPLPAARQKQVVPLAGPRKIIAERMAYSALTAPHITLSLRVDMSEATRLRTRVQGPIEQKTGQRLSFTAIVARAVAAVLPLHPFLNASLQDDRIILWDDVHLGIAASLEDYLIVPVIREAQTKSLEQIVSALADLVERARARRLAPAEMSGSTFTISNLGMFGIESFTAIINPPESAILAVGKIVDTPVSTEDGVELRPLMNLTLSADHRVVDGAMAAGFLSELKGALENPYLLI